MLPFSSGICLAEEALLLNGNCENSVLRLHQDTSRLGENCKLVFNKLITNEFAKYITSVYSILQEVEKHRMHNCFVVETQLALDACNKWHQSLLLWLRLVYINTYINGSPLFSINCRWKVTHACWTQQITFDRLPHFPLRFGLERGGGGVAVSCVLFINLSKKLFTS